MAERTGGGVGLRVRHSILFFALCSALDEASTFIRLHLGGVELNPKVSQLLNVHSLLYPTCDVALILLFHAVDRKLRRINDLWLIWAAAGVSRLVCLAFSIIGL